MFYTYIQNNSGGSFEINDELKHFVIIEADNGKEADSIAEKVGIYFDGVENGIDCSCCGDRWDRASYEEGTNTPKIYGGEIQDVLNYSQPFKEAIIYYKNGKKEVFKRE